MSVPRERADKVREALDDDRRYEVGRELVPHGSYLLTADEAETVRRADALVSDLHDLLYEDDRLTSRIADPELRTALNAAIWEIHDRLRPLVALLSPEAPGTDKA